jgi:hypothetical protein
MYLLSLIGNFNWIIIPPTSITPTNQIIPKVPTGTNVPLPTIKDRRACGVKFCRIMFKKSLYTL